MKALRHGRRQHRIIAGDCIKSMQRMEANSVDAVVCDPPYFLEFMGQSWDSCWKYGINKFGFKDAKFRNPAPCFNSSRNPMCKVCHRHKRGSKRHKPCVCAVPDFDELDHRLHDASVMQAWHYQWAVEALRVLKPGGHLLAFGSTRTHHRLMCALEDAGWELRDCCMMLWAFGSGFPKSLDVSRAIDASACRDDLTKKLGRTPTKEEFKAAWATWREVVGVRHDFAARANRNRGAGGWRNQNHGEFANPQDIGLVAAPKTDAAKQWRGFGSSLKPAYEPIILARKPLAGNVADNVLKHGTGALNIGATRIRQQDQQRGGHVCKQLSQLCGSGDTNGASLSIVLDAIESISSALRSCSIGDIVLSHDEVYPGDRLRGDAECVERLLHRLRPNGVWCVPNWKKTIGGSLPGCPSCFRFCDELFRRVEAVVREGETSLPDALSRICSELRERKYTHRCQRNGAATCLAMIFRSWLKLLAGELNTECSILQGRWPANLLLCHHPDCRPIGVRHTNGNGHYPARRGKGGLGTNGHGGQKKLRERHTKGEQVEQWVCVEGCPVRMLDEQSGKKHTTRHMSYKRSGGAFIDGIPDAPERRWWVSDYGGASRFFYTAKSSRRERNSGCESLPNGNNHCTVKPLSLMKYLVRLCTPPGGLILDPFCGSGSTLIAAILEGFDCIGLERERGYVRIARARLRYWAKKRRLELARGVAVKSAA